MAEIQALHRGERYPVKVSDCDSYLTRWTWRLTDLGHVYRNYSYRQAGKKRCRRIYLHRLIMALAQDDPRCVDHLNNDPLDNRRENLEVVTRAENTRRAHERVAAGGAPLRPYEVSDVAAT